MNIDDEIDTVAKQAWHKPSCQDEVAEAYLRKHTLFGQMQEAHDAWVALWHPIAQKTGFLWLMDTLSAWLQRLIDKLWETWHGWRQ